MNKINEEKVITPEEAAFILGLTPNTVRYHQAKEKQEKKWPGRLTVGYVLSLLEEEATEANRKLEYGRRLASRLFPVGEADEG